MKTITNEKAIEYITKQININDKDIESIKINVTTNAFVASYGHEVSKTFKVEKKLFWNVLEWLYENYYLFQKSIEGVELSDDDCTEVYRKWELSSLYDNDRIMYFTFLKVIMHERNFTVIGLTIRGDAKVLHLSLSKGLKDVSEVCPEERAKLMDAIADKYKGKIKKHNTFQILKDLVTEWEKDQKFRKACAEHLANIEYKVHYMCPSKTMQLIAAMEADKNRKSHKN